jgi:hypothetical protein
VDNLKYAADIALMIAGDSFDILGEDITAMKKEDA